MCGCRNCSNMGSVFVFVHDFSSSYVLVLLLHKSEKISRQEDKRSNGKYDEFCKTTIFLPLRNEYENVKRKLEQVISEIKTHRNVELLIIEACLAMVRESYVQKLWKTAI